MHFTYDESYQATPVVTSQAASELLRDGQQWMDTFTVRNPAPLTIAYTIAAGCPADFPICAPSQSTISVGPGQTVKVPVTYTTGAANPSASVTFSASYRSVGGRLVSGTVSLPLTIRATAPTIAITGLTASATISVLPDIGVAWCSADGTLATHTVAIDGVPLADTYASTTTSGCTTAGSSNWVKVPLTLGSHTLVASATDGVGHVTTQTLAFTFSLPPLTDFQPRVTGAHPAGLSDAQRADVAVRRAQRRNALGRVSHHAVVRRGRRCRIVPGRQADGDARRRTDRHRAHDIQRAGVAGKSGHAAVGRCVSGRSRIA